MANLIVRFMDMGMGDCIVAKLPGGEVLMVDCGSRRDVPRHLQAWNHMSDLVGTDIHALVLTHPDEDHYNRLGPVVPGDPRVQGSVTIHAIYHSMSLDKYTGYEDLVTQQWWGLDASKVFPVTHNSTGCRLGTTTLAKKAANATVALRERDSRGFVKILESTTNPPCNVWILASNVASTNRNPGEMKNAASVVTLIEYGAAKVLLTGDARIETENFLTSYANATLTNLTLAQMPHHGSARETFSRNFIQQLNPNIVLASVVGQNSDNCPNRPLLQHYEQFADALPQQASNTFSCWDVTKVPTGKRDSNGNMIDDDIPTFVTMTTTQKLWTTELGLVEIELDSNGTEVS
ncbi:hypothetical protein JY651_11595 [Pyxidicoccus parkwayensis]|uniref:Metallo-beta-lactamase domain-containing protein n=1 Tax=Pyxidicoccus parkwayensis TaxID=2813578 RepID=A0ABX7P4X8_9BACT|nr:MBL fold metallo-hydrolase [Pyxidicoccus parkwaysis]QSQ25529.1 hypothetical protein JY651_11595 [Pyxidicoccus parkwaysis]